MNKLLISILLFSFCFTAISSTEIEIQIEDHKAYLMGLDKKQRSGISKKKAKRGYREYGKYANDHALNDDTRSNAFLITAAYQSVIVLKNGFNIFKMKSTRKMLNRSYSNLIKSIGFNPINEDAIILHARATIAALKNPGLVGSALEFNILQQKEKALENLYRIPNSTHVKYDKTLKQILAFN